jgi:hypothetical protein
MYILRLPSFSERVDPSYAEDGQREPKAGMSSFFQGYAVTELRTYVENQEHKGTFSFRTCTCPSGLRVRGLRREDLGFPKLLFVVTSTIHDAARSLSKIENNGAVVYRTSKI